MTVTREELMAYLDGELPPGECARVEAALAADAGLRAEYERQKALGETLQNAFAPVLDAPLPDRLLQAARHKSMIDSIRDLFAVHPFGMGSSIAGAAIAAGLLLGIFVVPHEHGDYATRSDGLVARANLAHALDTQLASNQDHGGRITVGISFRNGNDRYCRTFTAGRSAGIACHDGGEWRVKALAPANLPGAEGSYRMAAGEMPDAIRDAVATMMRGTALDAAEESKARARGWH
jgi:hypothetical protein